MSGGPVPQHFHTATQRLQMGRCVVLHAALGGAPPGLALRTALGPLQRLAEKGQGGQGGGLWDLRCLSRSLVIQAEKAAQAHGQAFRVVPRGSFLGLWDLFRGGSQSPGSVAALFHAPTLQPGLEFGLHVEIS